MIDVSPGGVLLTGLLLDRTARFLVGDAQGIAQQLASFHDLRPMAARVAAESTIATVLMSAHIKGDERLTLQIQSQKPLLAFTADVDSHGGFRGRLTPSRVRLGPRATLDGLLFAIKSDLERELYRGMTALDGQTIEEALSSYLQSSAQVSTILRLGADVDAERTVTFAGGVLFERLPGADDDDASFKSELAALVERPLVEVLDDITNDRLGSLGFELMERRDLHWRCSCGQERIEAVLFRLGPTELRSMLAEDGRAEVVCHFCNIAYQVGPDRLRTLIEQHEPAGEA